jgi:hypothetical protein
VHARRTVGLDRRHAFLSAECEPMQLDRHVVVADGPLEQRKRIGVGLEGDEPRAREGVREIEQARADIRPAVDDQRSLG